jgi:hypothetical protein
MFDNIIPECILPCSKDNVKVNDETCMDITQCPDNNFTLNIAGNRSCETYTSCISKGRYVNFNENSCITWQDCYDKRLYANEDQQTCLDLTQC